MTKADNIYRNIPGDIPEELFEELFQSPSVKIERIVSDGHATPSGTWYDQDWDEWVILLSGSAIIEMECTSKHELLAPGDYMLIPRHQKHRVVCTDSNQKSIWLAVHITG